MTDSDDQLQAFGDFVRAQRRLAQVSQRNLARMSGVSDSYLSQIERGNYRPSPQVVKALATAFGLEPKQLYTMLGFMDEEESTRRAERRAGHSARCPARCRTERGVDANLPLVRGQRLIGQRVKECDGRVTRRSRLTMENQAQRPWLSLYRGVRPELQPACETALDMFRATLARNGSAPLVHYFDSSLTAAECDAMSDALAVGLQQRGVEAGDRVAVYLQNIPQVVIAVLAIWKCGAVVVPCNPMLRERELGKILRSSGCLAHDLPGRSLRRRRQGGAARDGRAAHDHDVAARVLGVRQAVADDAGRRPAQSPTRYVRHARDHRAARGRAAARRRADGRRRRVHGAHVGHDGRRQRRDEHAPQRRVRDVGLRSLDRPDARRRHPRARAAVPCHGPHRPRHARDADGQPAGAVLPVRRQRGVPPRGLAPRDVHGLRDHGVHRAAEQRRARQVRLEVADEALHGRRADAGERARGLARPHRRAHPADVRPHGGDVADAHDAARRDSADRSAYGRDVDRRARLQHARQGHDGRGPRSGPARDRRVRHRRAADRARLLAEARGDGEGADGRRPEDRRRRLHGRERLVLSRRPLEGHDHRVGIQGLAARGRGGAVSAPGRPRSGRRRRAGRVSRRDDQSRHQLEAGAEGDARRDPRVRARAHGRVQVSARRRDHGRPAEDDERQDHAPAAAADGARDRVAGAGRDRRRVVSAAARRARSARRARGGRGVAADEPRHAAALDDGQPLRAVAAHARAAARRPHVRRSRRVPRGQRGLSRGRRRSRRERAPVGGVPPPAPARPVRGGAQEHDPSSPRTASTSTST